MHEGEKISEIKKSHYLKHIYLIRDFCFCCIEALTKRELNLVNFYQSRAYRIIKDINNNFRPFSELDRIFILDVKDRLKRIFSKAVISFQNGEINEFKNLIEEIIIDTLDFEKVALGISLAQLSKDILVDSKYFNNNRITNVKQRGENE